MAEATMATSGWQRRYTLIALCFLAVFICYVASRVVASRVVASRVVASRVGGVPELVRDTVNGLLVEPAQINALADALEQALGRSWDAQQIRESVSHLSWQELAARNYEFLCAFETHGQQA